MRHRFWILISILMCLFGLSTVSIAQDENIIRYPILVEPTHLNPFISDTIATNTILRNLFDGLTQVDPVTGDILPAIADSWIIRSLDDGKQVFTFSLKQGLQYHQIPGLNLIDNEITADDIVWNYKLALHPDTSISERAPSLRFIDGAEDYQVALLANGEENAPPVLDDYDLPGVQALDDYTVQITLSAPDRLFLVDGMIAMVSPEAYMMPGHDFNRMPVGTGAYQFDEWLEGESIRIIANPDYFEPDLPRNDGVVYRLYDDESAALEDYRSGDIDVLLNFPSGERNAIIQEFSDEFFDLEGLHVRYWGFNMATGLLSENLLLRQAFSHALDRDTAWNVLAEGARIPAHLGMLPPSMLASTPACIYDYDLEQAAELLSEAGYPGGEGLPAIRIHLLEVIADEPQVALWEEALTGLGVEVEFIIEGSDTYWDSIVQDDVMIFQNGWAAGIVDPTAVFDFLILDGNGSMRYDNPAVNEPLRQARLELEPEIREDLYQVVHDTVMCDAVVIPSAYSRISWLQQPWIEEFVPGGGGTHTAPIANVITNR